MQVPLLNATLPQQPVMSNGAPVSASARGISGFVHIVLSIEDFETYGFQAVPFVIPLFKTIGEIAGVGALVIWANFRFQGAMGSIFSQSQERASSRLVAFAESELDTDRDYGQ